MAVAAGSRGGRGFVPVLAALNVLIVTAFAPRALAGAAAEPPPAGEVAELLASEPMTAESWPAWRDRLLGWINERGHRADAAFEAAWQFMRAQADAAGELAEPFASDWFAWYVLAGEQLHAAQIEADEQSALATLAAAERSVRRSLQINDRFARTHRNLARVLIIDEQLHRGTEQDKAVRESDRLGEAKAELAAARQLDSNLSLAIEEAQLAIVEQRFADAELAFRKALAEDSIVELARAAATAHLMNRQYTGRRAPNIRPLVDQFPDDGPLITYHAVALALDGDVRQAKRELDRARRAGTDPATVIRPDLVTQIERAGSPGLLERFGWAMLYFALAYALLMAGMAATGVVLARWTGGGRAIEQIGDEPLELVPGGQVIRTSGESGLARLYALALMAGLALFYVAIPFVVAGLLAGTALLLYGILQLPRIPVKLLVIVVVLGLGGAWAVLKSLFARPARGGFGLPKKPRDCPRLYELLGDVARRVDTTAVDEVYISPGSGIGVHQEGRGPFGIFGVARRVLTLGFATVSFISVGELRAILAHEYAHFSHHDTFYSRFVYQIMLSIEQALEGMGRSGGKLNYINPFFWFLYLYYKAYSLLAAGFSRSREFLADRMASLLFGSDVFASALVKVSTDGVLFEQTVYGNVARMLDQNQAFTNMYAALREAGPVDGAGPQRDALVEAMRNEKPALYGSHPTSRERLEAVAPLPRARDVDARPARALFDNPEKLEEELTEFLTGYAYHVRQAQAAPGA